MLRTLADHKTLTTVILDFPQGLDWSGLHTTLHSLPDTIEIFEIHGGTWSPIRSESSLPRETVVRLEPYTRLRRFRCSKEIGRRQILTGLLPFLQLCPQLQEFELDLTRLPQRNEKLVADTLLAYCPQINSLDLRFWETVEQMRLVQGYAFKKLCVCDFILRGPEPFEGGESAGPPSTIPFLTLSKDTLEVLELESTHCWTPYHNLDLILHQFPNLKELTMDLFDFQPEGLSSFDARLDSMAMTSASKLEKLTLWVHERPTSAQNQEAVDFCSMVSTSTLPIGGDQDDGMDEAEEEEEEQVDDDDNDNDEFSRHDDWSFTDLYGVLNDSVPPTNRRSSVALAQGIMQLHNRLIRFPHLKDLRVEWYIYRSPKAVWDYDGKFDVRGPLQAVLARQGLNRADLQKLNLQWTDYPAHDEDKEQDVDPTLKGKGFVLTDIEMGPRRYRVYGKHARDQMIMARRAEEFSNKKVKSNIEERMDEEDMWAVGDPYNLYKSRNQQRTRQANDRRQSIHGKKK